MLYLKAAAIKTLKYLLKDFIILTIALLFGENNMVDFTWMTGGKQGSGIDAALEMFSKIMIKHGYKTFGYREYFSNIKGMHSFFIVRVSEKEIRSFESYADFAVFFDNESVFGEKNQHGETIHEGHIRDIKSNGTLIIDKKIDKSKINRNDINIITIDFDSIIKSAAQKMNVSLPEAEITKNVVAVVSSAYLLSIEKEELIESISSTFRNKPQKVIDLNLAVADLTYESMKNEKRMMKLDKLQNESLYIEGTTAAAIGKSIAGCKIQVYYPITPASDESTFLEAHPELGIRVIQPESELAVIGIVAGASLAGVRAATSTSGPGFALMTETVSYAGMTETPLVIVDHQRGAPATGLPTRTEQGDLLFAIHQGHGDFDRIVLSPGTIEQMIKTTADAFNYAERYQLPVIVLGDKFIAQTSKSLKKDALNEIIDTYRVDRGLLVEHDPSKGEYKRYLLTNNGISPRIKLGDPNAVMYVAGDEHDEYGHVLEEPNNRNKMMEKRNKKKELILSELKRDEKYEIYNDPGKADLLIVTWGSSIGPVIDAIKEDEAALQIKLIQPYPKETIELLKNAKKTVIVEQNIGAQLKQHISSQTGFMIENEILKYNGRPIRCDELREAIDRIKNGEKKVILNGY